MTRQRPQLAPGLLGFLVLVLTGAQVRERRRRRIDQAGRSRDTPSAAPGANSSAAPVPDLVMARAPWRRPAPDPAGAGLAPSTVPVDPELAPSADPAGAGLTPSTVPAGAPPPTMASGGLAPGGVHPSRAYRHVQATTPEHERGEATLPVGTQTEQAPPALLRLLAVHHKRTLQREALLAKALPRLVPMARQPPLRSAGVPFPQGEAAVAQQAPLLEPPPSWPPAWLNAAVLPAPGATVPPAPHLPDPFPAPYLPAPSPGPRLPAPPRAPGLAQTPSPPPAHSLDHLRERLAAILRDDALRHGLDLKEG